MSEPRGSIWIVTLDPVIGTETYGQRHVIVISNQTDYGPSIVVPITIGGPLERGRGFSVSMQGFGLRTSGVALCHQIRTIDLRARKARLVEIAPIQLADVIAAKVASIIDA